MAHLLAPQELDFSGPPLEI